MPSPSASYPAKRPVPARVRVNKTTGTGMEIVWKDGHHSHWDFAWLRNACPCATCVQEREAVGRKPGEAPPQPVSLLPMYKAPVRAGEVVNPSATMPSSFHWSDGHKSGIYSLGLPGAAGANARSAAPGGPETSSPGGPAELEHFY